MTVYYWIVIESLVHVSRHVGIGVRQMDLALYPVFDLWYALSLPMDCLGMF